MIRFITVVVAFAVSAPVHAASRLPNDELGRAIETINAHVKFTEVTQAGQILDTALKGATYGLFVVGFALPSAGFLTLGPVGKLVVGSARLVGNTSLVVVLATSAYQALHGSYRINPGSRYDGPEGLREFFRLTRAAQYAKAQTDPGLRQYLIDFAQAYESFAEGYKVSDGGPAVDEPVLVPQSR